MCDLEDALANWLTGEASFSMIQLLIAVDLLVRWKMSTYDIQA
jgi:hypothetical protein